MWTGSNKFFSGIGSNCKISGSSSYNNQDSMCLRFVVTFSLMLNISLTLRTLLVSIFSLTTNVDIYSSCFYYRKDFAFELVSVALDWIGWWYVSTGLLMLCHCILCTRHWNTMNTPVLSSRGYGHKEALHDQRHNDPNAKMFALIATVTDHSYSGCITCYLLD